MKIKSKVLIIAGSDSSGGAGIQADIKTVTALGSYAMTAITAVTSQNTTGILSIEAISPREISKQIEFTSKDIKPDTVKIGMLHSTKVIKAVLNSLNKIKAKKIILDPVMVAKGGAKLINDASIKILKSKLIKRVSLITPNIPEAEILTKISISSVDDMMRAAKILPWKVSGRPTLSWLLGIRLGQELGRWCRYSFEAKSNPYGRSSIPPNGGPSPLQCAYFIRHDTISVFISFFNLPFRVLAM